MKIEISWANEEKTLLLYTFQKDWTWAEIPSAFKKAYEMIDSVDTCVDVIMDFSQAKLLPSGAISQFRRSLNNEKHDNVGTTFMVGTGMFIPRVVDVSRKIVGKAAEKWPIEFADSVEEAIKKLEESSIKQSE